MYNSNMYWQHPFPILINHSNMISFKKFVPVRAIFDDHLCIQNIYISWIIIHVLHTFEFNDYGSVLQAITKEHTLCESVTMTFTLESKNVKMSIKNKFFSEYVF